MSAASRQREDVLFLMRSPAYVRNFDSVLRALGGRGRRVTVLFEQRKGLVGLALIGRLSREYETLRYEFLGPLPLGVRGRVKMALEAGQDYLRYFDPPYGEASRLRSRAIAPLPDRLERPLAAVLRRFPRGRRALASAARRAARRLDGDPAVRKELDRRRPRTLVVTPMIQFRSRQNAWVDEARALGIRTMLCVYSWDNLTNKGLMHAYPDRIAVWNDAQRSEAIERHGADPASILVAGAWPYDHWFGWEVSRSREEFCRELGLSAERAIVLYTCSSKFIARRERPAVVRWVRALRSSPDPRVATANVIVRPHPLNTDEWSEPLPADLPGVTVFPPHGADPEDDSSRADYFDSIAHADAVVGVNTSALIESAILDRPALAFPGPEFRSSQEELPHFRELVGERGMLKVSASMGEHLDQLSQTLAGGAEEAALRQGFVETFIRPLGADTPPTERIVAAIDELAEASGAGGEPEPSLPPRMPA